MVQTTRTRPQDSLPPLRERPSQPNVFGITETIIERIREGYKLVLVPADDEHPDALPELTRSLRSDSSYVYLVSRPHRWRRQLSFRGRRLTVGQLLARMHAEGWSVEETANQFELPIAAIDEAVAYGAQFATLIAAEHARDLNAVRQPVDAVFAR